MDDHNHFDVEDSVVDILSRVLSTPQGKLRSERTLSSYTWNSMAVMEAFVQLEDRFRTLLELPELARARSIDDVVELVAGRLRAEN
jgi:acyl carrier protein